MAYETEGFMAWRGATLSGALHGFAIAAIAITLPTLFEESPTAPGGAASSTEASVPDATILPLVLSPDAALTARLDSATSEAGEERVIALDVVVEATLGSVTPDPFDPAEPVVPETAPTQTAATREAHPDQAADSGTVAAAIRARTTEAPTSLEAIAALLARELEPLVEAARAEDLESEAADDSGRQHFLQGALAEAAGSREEAVAHYRAAATLGHLDAAVRLGNLLAAEAGGGARVEAMAAWLVAAEHGVPLALAGVEALSERLSPSERAEAKVVAARFEAQGDAWRALTLGASDADALEAAAAAGDATTVEALLDQGVTPSAKALLAATAQGTREAAEALLARGADANAKDATGRTALMNAALRGDDTMALGLLRRGAEIDARDDYGRSALSEAAWSGRPLLVGLLLDLGAAVDAPTADGATPLMWAALNGHGGVVDVLVAWGAAVDARDAAGFTPLIRAAWNGHDAVVRALLAAGADARARAADGTDARGRAEGAGYPTIAALLDRP